jgi:UDP-N-acetylglucosamine 4-epimerase
MKIGQLPPTKLSYRDFRVGDVRHLLADISKAQTLLDYDPTTKVRAGVAAIMPWYVSKVAIK